MTASNLPSWAVNVQCGVNAIALHGLIQTATLSKKKKREVKQQGLVHLPALACVDGGVVKPSIKIGVEDRAHTHLDLPLQSIPKEWRPAITVTDPDNRLIYADWRACHLQLIAYCSGDTAMTQFFESSPDFYTALPVPKPPMPADPDEQAKWRKKVKYALNAYLNGSTGPALVQRDRGICWKQSEAEAFVAGLDTLFQTAWQKAGDWCNHLRDDVYDCARYIAHCEENDKTRTKRKALGIGLMRLEAEMLNSVLDHPTFSESYGGSVVMPMRDGVLVECPAKHQADLAQWLGAFMTRKSTDGNEDRCDNHVATHVDVEVYGTSWGQVDGEDVAPLVGSDFLDEASDEADSGTTLPGLLLAAARYPLDLKARAATATGTGSRGFKNAATAAARAIKDARGFRDRKTAPPAPPPDNTLATLTPRLNADGDVIGIANTVTNLERVIGDASFNLWFSEWDKEIYSETTGERLDEKTWLATVTRRCEQSYGWEMKLSVPLINSATLLVAQRDKRHPLRDDIDALEWDGVPRLDSWLQQAVYGNAITCDFSGDLHPEYLKDYGISMDEYTLTGKYGRLLLIAMMARLYDPGCKSDEILVLAGLQGVGKQKLFAALAGKCRTTGFEYYGGTKREAKTADAALQGLKLWLWEDQEMSSHVGKRGEDVKAFLSNKTDDARLPYGRSTERIKRHWIPVGSTNDPEKLLQDPTGSRRYNCVRIPFFAECGVADPMQPQLDVEWVAAHRDLLLAEAREAYRQGERWWLESGEGGDPEFQLRHKVNKSMFTRTTPMGDFASDVYTYNSGGADVGFKVEVFLSEYDPDMKNYAMNGKPRHDAEAALKMAGFIPGRPRRKDGTNPRVWYKKVQPGATPIAESQGFRQANMRRPSASTERFSSGPQFSL